MGDIDCDDFGIDSAMRRARRIRWVNSRTVPYVAVDSDDTAPGLETESGGVCASFDCDYDDHHPMHRMLFLKRSEVWACVDCGHVDRPSPGDDITRAAFDAMDREGS